MSRKKQENQKITALYCRISLDDGGDNESMSISNQKIMLRDFAEKNGMFQHEYYVDATVIIGLKQNPTHGRRFSPVFLLKSGILWGKTQNATTKRRKTEYGMG